MIFRSPKKNPILAWSSKFPEPEQDERPPSPESVASLISGLTLPGLEGINDGRTYWVRLPGLLKTHKTKLRAETGKLSGQIRLKVRSFGLRPAVDLTLGWQRKDTNGNEILLELSSNGGFRTNRRLDAIRQILLWRFMVKLAAKLRGKDRPNARLWPRWKVAIKLMVLKWRSKMVPNGPILVVVAPNREPAPPAWSYLNHEIRYNERIFIIPLNTPTIGFNIVFGRPDQSQIELTAPWRWIEPQKFSKRSWHSKADFFYINTGDTEFKPNLESEPPIPWRPNTIESNETIFRQIRSLNGRGVIYGQEVELNIACPVNKIYGIEKDEVLQNLLDTLHLPLADYQAYLLLNGEFSIK